MPLAKIMAADAARKEMAEENAATNKEASRIFKEEGEEAHAAYLKKVDAERARKSAQKKVDREALIEKLLIEEGYDPWRSMKGKAVMFEFDYGIDLYQVPGTEQEAFENLKRVFPDKYDDRVLERQRLQTLNEVESMMDEGMSKSEIIKKFQQEGEKMEHLTGNPETMKLKMMREKNKKKKAEKKQPVREETPAEDVAAAVPQPEPTAEEIAAKEKEAKLKAKADAKAQKEKAKADAKALKEKKKAETKAAKETAAKEKAAAKAAVVAAAAGAAAASAGASAGAAAVGEAISGAASDVIDGGVEASPETPGIEKDVSVTPSTESKSLLSSSRVPKIVAASAVVGASGFVTVTMMKKKAQKEEEEREKQFKLLMGIDEAGSTPPKPTTPPSSSVTAPPPTSSAENESPPPVPAAPLPSPSPPPKKKKRGITSIFSKKSSRPTSLSSLADPFSTLLSSLLSLGAPGRFPSLPSPPTTDPAASQQMLSDTISELKYTPEETGEAFASVVNCMIIDIVDLAASALKGKNESVVIDGLNVVMDFMDYSATLFDAVAANVTITPVTYEGTLSKAQLEKLYAVYATASLTNFDAAATGAISSDRVDVLQQVLDISDKRAEALMQKTMMKNLMDAMKDGGGEGGDMNGLAEMMSGMGMNPEDMNGELSEGELKQSVGMMKELVESGSITKEEVQMVKEQFKQAYGEDIEDLIKQADEGDVNELGEDGKELLDLFKTVLKED